MQQKQNIEAPVITGPKVVGFVDLGEGSKPAVKAKFSVHGNFPMKHYDAINELVRSVNKKLGKDTITLSKVAKAEGKELPDHGSIWFSCEWKQFRDSFLKQYDLLMVGLLNDARRITKAEMLAMPYGQRFVMAYMMPNHVIKASPCIKIFTSKKATKVSVSYVKTKDVNQNANDLLFTDINDDGTFKADKTTGYLYISNQTEVADL
jgi:hypothetical protein